MRSAPILLFIQLLALVVSSPIVPHANNKIKTTYLYPKESFENRSTDGAYGYKYGAQTTDIESLLVVNMMDVFVNRLREYVNETRFDILAFDTDKAKLDEAFSHINIAAARVPPSGNIAHRRDFSKRLYHAMLDASRIMKIYDDFSREGNALVYRVVELNIRALVMSNSHGSLDLHISDYLNKLVRLYHNLNAWVGKFKKLQHVAWGTRQLFNSRVKQAERVLENLRLWVPL